jgi:hypothetical protein
MTPAEGMKAYMHKYTYICICDSLIIGKFHPVYIHIVYIHSPIRLHAVALN